MGKLMSIYAGSDDKGPEIVRIIEEAAAAAKKTKSAWIMEAIKEKLKREGIRL